MIDIERQFEALVGQYEDGFLDGASKVLSLVDCAEVREGASPAFLAAIERWRTELAELRAAMGGERTP